MSSSAAFRRNPLIIDGNSLSSGERSTTFRSGSADALLRSYLIFVRDLRGQRREPSIELRSEDVAVIATHLGTSEQFVLGGLLDLMGATRAQRTAMMAMLAAGALTLVLTGSFVSDLSSDGVSVEMTRLADAVRAAATVADDADPTATAAPAAQAMVTSTRAPAASPRGATDAPDAGPVPNRPPLTLSHATPSPDVLRSAAAAVVAGDAPVDAGDDGDTPVATAELPDGSTVAVAAPPVPPETGEPDEPVATAELPDGSTVAVVAPPVPPPPPG